MPDLNPDELLADEREALNALNKGYDVAYHVPALLSWLVEQRREVAKWKDENARTLVLLEGEMKEAADLRVQVRRLREWVEKAGHQPDCVSTIDRECTCGRDELLKETPNA